MADEPLAVIRLIIDNEPPDGSPPGPPDDGDDSQLPIWCSDDALAAARSEKLGENWLCVHPGAAWYRWTGKVWQPDHKRRVVEIARRVCCSIANGLPKDSLSLKRKICSRERVQAAVALATTDPQHTCTFDDFDRDPFALNTPIGIVDLRAGQLRAHSREARLTKITAVAPEGDCPTWLSRFKSAGASDSWRSAPILTSDHIAGPGKVADAVGEPRQGFAIPADPTIADPTGRPADTAPTAPVGPDSAQEPTCR